MAVSGSSFVDEIYDQFLVCRMCSEVYTSPKVLACMHSFCEKCLETHYDMEEQERPYRFLVYNRALNCPLCHSRTELPTGGIHRLPDNFLVANLSAVVGRCKPGPSGNSAGAWVCEICRPGPLHNEADAERAAVSKCLDCGKLLCGACTELHRKTRVTERHGLFDVRPDRDSDSRCKRHQNEALRFYCEECEECVCVLCTFHDHRDHDVTSLVDALNLHRRPFEALMERCRGRIDGLRTQVELIERCERGLKRAEERIRDSAIDAIAAIRKREKDLLTEMRESLDEQTLGFIGEKSVFKENLRNLEGSFDETNAMLNGTKLDLLIVRKEMEKKLTSILESGIKSTPDLLKRNVQFCCEDQEREDYYPDVVQGAFDRMGKSNRFLGHTETGRPEVQTVATETDPEFAPDLISKLDQKEEDDPDTARGRDSTWRRPMAVVVATDTPRAFGTVTLRPIDGLPRTGETATQTPRPVLVDGSTEMARLVLYEKETNTPFVHVTQKGVSTDNQVMVDRATSTILVDVTAAYRGAATTKRSVMVSRGTCTPRTVTNPMSTAARGCSPVDWVSVSAISENEIAGVNPSILQVPPNYSADHVTVKSTQENTNPIRSTPSAVGASTPAAVGASTPAVVGASTTAVVGASTPAAVGVSTPAVVGARGVSKTQAQYKQDEPKLAPPVTPSPATAAVNTSTPPSVAAQARPREGQGSSRGQEVSRNPVPLNQIQVGKVVFEELGTLSKVQSIPASQGNKDLMRSLPALPGSNPMPGIKEGQLNSQVFGQKSINGAQIPSPGPEVPFPPGPPSQAPGSLPGSQSMIGNQRSQVRLQGSANVPGVQTTPEAQRFQVPIASPGMNYLLPASQGSQVRIIGPTNVPAVQSIHGTQGQVRTVGPTNLPGVQSNSGTQGQERTMGPTNVPAVQSIPGTQGSQVRTMGPTNVPAVQSISGTQGQVLTMGPTNVPAVQSIPGTQGSQIRTMGPTNVPGAQSIPGIQAGQVRTIGPANVPAVQSIPGTQGSQVRTMGPTNVPAVQSIPGTQGQVRTMGPTNVPAVQSIPGTQGSQVRTMGPANVPAVQSIPGIQGQVRAVCPTNVPAVQSIPGTQGQVRTIGPTNVPGTQFVPGTYGGPAGTQYTSPEAVTSRVLTGPQFVSSITSTSAIVEAKGALTTQPGQSSKQNSEAKTVTLKDNFHVRDPISLSTNDCSSEPLKESPVQSIPGSQAQNLPGENLHHNVISVIATSANQDVIVALAMSSEAVATSATGKTSSESNNSGSNAIKESTTADRVPQSFLPSSIITPQAREIIETAGRAPAGNAAVGHNPGVSVGSSSVTPGISQNKSAAGLLPQTSPVRENSTTFGNKPDENPQNPTIPIKSNDPLNPNPSTDRPTPSPQQKTDPKKK